MSRAARFAVILTGITLLCPGAASANEYLERARQARAAVEYEQVLPLLARALEIATTPQEELEIHELTATMQVMYERTDLAVAAFVEVLHLQPDFTLPPGTSPKVRDAFAEARRRFAESLTTTPAVEGSPATAGAVEPPAGGGWSLIDSWWFWAAVGVVVAGTGVGIWLAAPARSPETDFAVHMP